ncbi:hypothetical protein [Belnapia sp. F-4-1]|uniref:hypothetical protein n=1 Tax=Belnapia sp. F-4-1 TaxID=1545443 RepID=UPI0005B93723|nr:hypothetical protein [Belnapia sp. F-4-1]
MLTFRALPNSDRSAMQRHFLDIQTLDRIEPPASLDPHTALVTSSALVPVASLPNRPGTTADRPRLPHNTVMSKLIWDDTASLSDPKSLS